MSYHNVLSKHGSECESRIEGQLNELKKGLRSFPANTKKSNGHMVKLDIMRPREGPVPDASSGMPAMIE